MDCGDLRSPGTATAATAVAAAQASAATIVVAAPVTAIVTTPVTLLIGLLAGCSDAPDPARYSGYAEAEPTYVAAASAGTLMTLGVARGDRVTAGQALFALDDAAERLATDAARAREAQAQAQQADLQKGRRPLELQALAAQQAQAQAMHEASASAWARQRELVDQGFVAPLTLDALRAADRRDAARVGEVAAQRAYAREPARADALQAADAAVKGAQSELALARWRQAERARAAPVSAVVQDVLYRVGEWVPAGAPVVVLLPPGALRLRFYVPEPQLADVAVGRTLDLACDGCPPGLQARVRWVSAEAEFTPPVLYGAGHRAKLVFKAEAEPLGTTALKPGQPVDLRLAP